MTKKEVAMAENASLQALHAEVKTEYAEIEKAARRLPIQAWRLGGKLLQAKSMVAHGEFGGFLRDAGIPLSTANYWMKLNRDLTLEQVTAHGSIRAAMKALLPAPDGAESVEDEFEGEYEEAEAEGEEAEGEADDEGGEGAFADPLARPSADDVRGPDMPPGTALRAEGRRRGGRSAACRKARPNRRGRSLPGQARQGGGPGGLAGPGAQGRAGRVFRAPAGGGAHHRGTARRERAA